MSSEGRTEFQQRLSQLVEKLGGPSSLARKTGISRGAIYKYLSGKSDPTREMLIKIAEAGGVTQQWLATGTEPGAAIPADIVRVPILQGRSGGMSFDSEFLGKFGEAEPDNFAVVIATNDSMAPTIAVGDTVLIDRRHRKPEEGIFALHFGVQIALRRISVSAGGIRLSSDNPAVPPAEPIPWADAAKLDVIGRAVWIGHKLA